jgi:Co/Zn/Cd efflux system component
VVTDAATSVLAIVALLGGWLAGWAWLDPAMGIAGAVLVALWARGLIGQTATVLLDREMDHPVVERLRGSLAAAGHRVVDLHVWRVGRSAYACTLTLEPAHADVTADDVRRAMHGFAEIAHTTIELRPAAG